MHVMINTIQYILYCAETSTQCHAVTIPRSKRNEGLRAVVDTRYKITGLAHVSNGQYIEM